MLRPGKLGANGQSEPGGPVHWTRGELIGQGAFGKVYMGLNSETGQLMAVKQVASSRLPCMSKAGAFRPMRRGGSQGGCCMMQRTCLITALLLAILVRQQRVGAAEVRDKRLQVAISKDKHVAGRVREHLNGLEAEVNVLRRLDHPNIVRYLVRP